MGYRVFSVYGCPFELCWSHGPVSQMKRWGPPRDMIWPAVSPGLMCDEFVLSHSSSTCLELEISSGRVSLGAPTFPGPALAGDAIKTASHKVLQSFCLPALLRARKPWEDKCCWALAWVGKFFKTQESISFISHPHFKPNQLEFFSPANENSWFFCFTFSSESGCTKGVVATAAGKSQAQHFLSSNNVWASFKKWKWRGP